MNESIAYTREGAVGVVTLNHPKANAYDAALLEALLQTVREADADASTGAVLVRSALPKFFGGGADIKAFAANTTEANRGLVLTARAVLQTIEGSGKVFIAVIAGHALGGGLELAMGCDLRFAAETGPDGDYLLGLPEVRLGLMPGNGGSVRLPRLVGPSRALDLLTTGRTIGPAEAWRLGLVDRLLPAESLDAEALAYAESIAQGPSVAIAAIKQSVYRGTERDLESALRLEAELVDPLYDAPDAAEGLAAFLEKRPPQFGKS